VTGRSETEVANPPSGVQVRPLAYTLVACVAVAILTVFSGTGDPGGFSDGLTLPRTWFPPLLLLLMHSVYLLVFGFLLYRAQVLPAASRVKAIILVGGALLFQALWNPALSRMAESGDPGAALGIAAGGAAVYALWLTALAVLLLRRDRIAGFTLAPYLLLAFHDLWWAWALSQLN